MIPDWRLYVVHSPSKREALEEGVLCLIVECPSAGHNSNTHGHQVTTHSCDVRLACLRRLARLEVLEENVESLALLSVVSDNDAGAADNLPGVALSVDLAETGPGSEGLGVRDLEEVDLVLVAESLNELDVLLLRAGLDEDTEVGLSSVESLGALSETTGETVVDQRLLQDFLESVLDGHGTLGGGSWCLCLSGNLLDGGLLDLLVVRHFFCSGASKHRSGQTLGLATQHPLLLTSWKVREKKEKLLRHRGEGPGSAGWMKADDDEEEMPPLLLNSVRVESRLQRGSGSAYHRPSW